MMKKTIFLLAMFLIAFITIRCKQDAEIPALKFEIDVKTDATISEKGINDESVIKFDMKTEYDYTSAPLSYKIDYKGIGVLKHEGKELNKDATYKLEQPELTLTYIGKEAGNHIISVHFFNDKGVNVFKSVEIPYVKYNFTVEVTGEESPYQGETKEYKLKITPDNTTIKDTYKLKFISYDEKDVNLEKSYVALNGTKIEFNKEYTITNLASEQIITLNSFNAGEKNLIYTIINSSSEKQEKISQAIKQSQVEIKNISFDKLITNTLGDNLQLRGFIEKTPALSKKIQYKSWIVDVANEQKDGVVNTDNTYIDHSLPDNNEFVLNVKVNKYGTYKYMIQFKDEFGTETTPYSFEIKAINKTFEIEQKATTNLENIKQGQDVEVSIEVKEADTAANEEYQIQFLSFDSNDELLQKSKILLNNERVRLNEWYNLKKNFVNRLVFNSFNAGDKKIFYKIKNSIYTKSNELSVSTKKAAISIKDITLKTGNIYINMPFKIEGKVEKTYPESKSIEYKTWLASGNATDIKDITGTYKSYNLLEGNLLSLQFTPVKVGQYILKVQAKDEYGNESEIKEIPINVIGNEFNVEQKIRSNISNLTQGQNVEFDLEVKEGHSTSEDFQIQFLSFDPSDVYLQKAKIRLNGVENIQLNKWYPLNKSILNKVILTTFNAGNKKLVYQVKNSMYNKNGELNFSVNKSAISIKNITLKTGNIYINMPFKIEGKVEKTYPESKSIEYKTWLASGNATDIKDITGTYKSYNLLEGNLLSLQFTPVKVGQYILKVQAKDEYGNESEIKEIPINVIGNEFNVEQKIRSNISNLTQGQNVEFDLEVKEGHSTSEDFQIQFLSFDPSDVYLQKAKIRLNGVENIQLNKWYPLNKSILNKVILTTFNAGNKKLVYQVKNSMYSKNGELNFSVNKSAISLKNVSLIADKIYINEQFKIEGKIEKTYPDNRNIEYKTWLSAGNDSKFKDLTNTYRSYELFKDNIFSLSFRVTEVARYTLKVQAKDEYGNESEIKEFPINVLGNDFNVEQKLKSDISNLLQGQDVELDFEMNENHPTNETFQIQFLSFDPSDVYLQKAKIKLNNADVQLNKWYAVNKGSINKIVLSTFYAGTKKLKYQVKNSMYTKDKELDINVRKTTISLRNLTLKADKIYINEPFKIDGKVEKSYPNNKKIEYKTWLSSGNAAHISNITGTYRNYDFTQNNNILSLEFKATNVGNFKLNVQAKDEFGNESEVREFNIKADSKIEIEKAEQEYLLSLKDYYENRDSETYWHSFDCSIDSNIKIKARAGNGNLLYKMTVEVESFKGLIKGFNKEFLLGLNENIDNTFAINITQIRYDLYSSTFLFPNSNFNAEGRVIFDERAYNKWKKTKPTVKITLYDNLNNKKEITIPLSIKLKYTSSNSYIKHYYELNSDYQVERIKEFFETYHKWVLEEEE